MWAGYFRVEPMKSHASPGGAPSGFSVWIRKAHRALAIVFTATVVANFVVMAWGTPPAWITYSPLPPLFLMLFSGLYMFFLPYVARRREDS